MAKNTPSKGENSGMKIEKSLEIKQRIKAKIINKKQGNNFSNPVTIRD